MEATIIISEREEKAGTGKNGKPYLLTTLISNNGNKYSGFRIDKEIKPGYSVKLMAKESKFKNNYDIERVIEYDASPISDKPIPKGEAGTTKPQPMTPSPLTPEMQVEFMNKAFKAMELKHGVDWDPLVYGELVAELVREYHAEWMSSKISAEQKARWGK